MTIFEDIKGNHPGIETFRPEAVAALWEACASDSKLAEDLSAWRLGYVDEEPWTEILGATLRTQVLISESTINPGDIAKDMAAVLKLLRPTQDDGYPSLESLAKGIEPLRFSFTARLTPSPLFPGGREAKIPVIKRDGSIVSVFSELDTPYGVLTPNGVPMPDSVFDEIKSELQFASAGQEFRARRRLAQYELPTPPRDEQQFNGESIVEKISVRDEERFQTLRNQYGAKAANLICFSEAVREYNVWAATQEGMVQITIPSFYPVGVDLYRTRLDDNFAERVESLRKHVENMVDSDSSTLFSGGLVAVRSSAIHSEDGDSSNAAGIYESVAVDPRDSAAFLEAIKTVYASLDSEGAQAYRQKIGLATPEEMGLVIQNYREELEKSASDLDMVFNRPIGQIYGHAYSYNVSGNLVDVVTNYGELQYSRRELQKYFGRRGCAKNAIHADYDDITSLGKAQEAIIATPLLALAAEQYFGGPALIEFVGDELVQLRRDLSDHSEKAFEFPDLPILCLGASIGSGDEVVDVLPWNPGNHNRRGLVVLYNEHDTGGVESHDRRYYPEAGAVLIRYPSSAGHARTICKEQGLLCIFPSNTITGSDSVKSFQLPADKEGKPLRLRIVSSGGEARIYLAE